MRVYRALPKMVLFSVVAVVTLCGCAHRSVMPVEQQTPRVDTFERRLNGYLADTTVDGRRLSEFLEALEVNGCLEAQQGDLTQALHGLRRLHRRTYEHADPLGRLAVWEIWRRKLVRFSPDGRKLVEIYLDHPPMGDSFFFCIDDLPTSWRNLEADDYIERVVAYMAAEVEERRAALVKEGADGAKVVEELRELHDQVLRRFDAQFDEEGQQAAARASLQTELRILWLDEVDPHDYGVPVLPRELTVPGSLLDEMELQEVGEAATYSDHPAAAGRGAGGGAVPQRDGFAIADPADVARRDRTVRSWQRTRRIMIRNAKQDARLLGELETELLDLDDPRERAALLREMERIGNRLDHTVADLGHHQQVASTLRTGSAVSDKMVGRASRKENRRTWRKRRKVLGDVREDAEQTLGRARVEVYGEDAVADLESVTDGGGGATGGPLADLLDNAGGGTPQLGTVEPAEEGNSLVYEGPCPIPDAGWSAEIVAGMRAAYPFMDDVDTRIFLSLLRRTYTSLGGTVGVEQVVERHLSLGLDLRLDRGQADGLSEIYDPERPPEDQDEIRFYVRLEL